MIADILAKLDAKDLIPIILSLIAILVTTISWLITHRRESSEERRNIRSQLTDIISKIMEISAELDKVRNERRKSTDDDFFGSYLDRLKRQISLRAEYVGYLIEEHPKSVVSIDYANLALGCQSATYYDQADTYWKKFIEHSAKEARTISKGMNTRRYADFLFFQGETEEAILYYQKSVDFLTIEQDQARWEKGYTYIKLAERYHELKKNDSVEKCLSQAEETFRIIKRDARKEEALELLNQARDKLKI